MKITFSQLFKDSCELAFDIPESLVIKAIENATEVQSLDYEEFELDISIYPIDEKETLLLITKNLKNTIEVYLAFRIKDDLDENIKKLKPIEMLKRLVEVFGIYVRIKQYVSKIFINQTLKVTNGNSGSFLFDAPDKHRLVIAMDFNGQNPTQMVCQLVFVLDATLYSRWLISN